MSRQVTLSWPSKGMNFLIDPKTGRWFSVKGDDIPVTTLRQEFVYESPILQLHQPSLRDNLVIFGDNLLAMRNLLPEFGEKVDLIYIDPPFKMGHPQRRSSDALEDGVWLSVFFERAKVAAELLKPGRIFCVHLNSIGQPYARVILDTLFGPGNLVSQISWQRAPDRTLLGQGQTPINDTLEYILVYSKGRMRDDLPPMQKQERLSWRTFRSYSRILSFSPQREVVDSFIDSRGHPATVFKHDWYKMEPFDMPNETEGHRWWHRLGPVFPRLTRLTNQQAESSFQQELLSRMTERDLLYSADFIQSRGKYKGKRTRYYLNGQIVLFLSEVAQLQRDGIVRISDLNNLWTHDEIPATGIAGEGGVTLKRSKKPERLLERIVECFSKKGELVLDYFAGSGTTGAVAHKMQRRWIMIEALEKPLDMCIQRMKRVCDGKDPRGITRDVGWMGGGGFRVLKVLNSGSAP
ncbi:MAG: DNA methyltransferase [Bacillota bacterium]|jgi:adenine-specific DNA-methyltransferase